MTETRPGWLVAVEGIDGSGKQTLTDRLTAALEVGHDLSVGRLAFPRYRESLTADLAAEALHGQHGSLRDSEHAMALLFSLDRVGAADLVDDMRRRHDIVLLDRYVSSNAAYGMGRHTDPEVAAAAARWVEELEYGRLALPRTDLQILLDVPVDLAEQRARGRAALDTYESDRPYQARVADAYRTLASQRFGGEWLVITGDTDPWEVAATLVERLA